MKRKKFILSSLTIAALPLLAKARLTKTVTRPDKGFIISAGEGRLHGHITLKGVNSNVLDLKISGSDTDGGFALFEQTSVSPGRGTPLHVHHFQDEVFYVLEGSYYFQVGAEKFHANAGDSIFLPMKIPHAWTQVSEKGKMTVMFQPAGKMESFFVSLAAMDKIPSPVEMAKLFEINDMQIVGPPLAVS